MIDLLAERVKLDLKDGGALSRSLPGYEEREEQIQMAEAVAEAINQSKQAVIEASTGTGKSLAYLLPIIRSSKVAIISTANKNLQEQLFYKDIPFVQKHVKSFKAALLKGMSNYVCLARVNEERNTLPILRPREFSLLEEALDDERYDGDLDMLPFRLPPDTRSRVSTDYELCAWRACPFYSDCYVRKTRQRAEEAQVIVVNHTLLLLDTAMAGALLPARDVIVIDEAHHLEEEATRAYTVTVSAARVEVLLQTRRLITYADDNLRAECLKLNELAWRELAAVADPGMRPRTVLSEPLEQGQRLGAALDTLAERLKCKKPEDLEPQEAVQFDKLVERTSRLAYDLKLTFAVADLQKRVYYVERLAERSFERSRRGEPRLTLSSAPISVSELLAESLFAENTVITTSATLAIGGDFSFYRRQVGITPQIELELPLSFDYAKQALLYVPRHITAPVYGEGSGPYLQMLAQEMLALVEASRGRAFLLFSSRRTMDTVYEWLAPRLSYPLFLQGELPRQELTARFRKTPNGVLFGVKSFWEGVDIVGAALSLVVIDKLPFDPPDDPVHEARVKAMKEAGENWFGGYVLPLAILRLKQGIGRLLRSKTDRGVMAILDSRLHSKSYGRQVLAALPPAKRTLALQDVFNFFAQEGKD